MKPPGRPADFVGIMARILGDMRRPMQRGELVAAVEERGVTIPSEDKARYLGTILWRNRDQFVNIPEAGYWLADAPCPAVDYTPGDILDGRTGDTEEGAVGGILDMRDKANKS